MCCVCACLCVGCGPRLLPPQTPPSVARYTPTGIMRSANNLVDNRVHGHRVEVVLPVLALALRPCSALAKSSQKQNQSAGAIANECKPGQTQERPCNCSTGTSRSGAATAATAAAVCVCWVSCHLLLCLLFSLVLPNTTGKKKRDR